MVAMGGPKNTMTIGADGEVMHSLHADKSGTIDAGLIPYTALKDGSVDLYDIALLNDHLAVKADNQRRIEKWREDNER